MLNVALLSRWHVHADDYANQVRGNDDMTITMVWDEDLERGKQWAQELGVPFEAELDEVLSDDRVDGVIVNTPTNLHKKVIIKAAQYKKHIFTEKILAFTIQDCQEIMRVVENNGIHLMVSLPRLTDSYYLYAQYVLDRGLLGRLTLIRCRFAHNGAVPSDNSPSGWLPDYFFNKEQSGGGALIDLGAHPIYLTNRLAGGAAKEISATLQSIREPYDVDDNALVTIEYEAGVLGVVETSFLSSGSPFQLELYGTEGTLLIEDEKVKLKTNTDNTWVTVDELPSPLLMPMEQWVKSIKHHIEPTITKEDVLHLTAINQAASLSNTTGQKVKWSDII
ncbi:gfo/Idh/MocA family oxidoreductase [Gracilibacillus salitolerans]|uniref:Gfo/Idh/MocA family oxidoreductase n=1 Tax=Gracilibacillus salitolerans TaxID=2663022 RepID=A0A5Q2TNU0_9BACI|nr:Gfo/Idh/MocA family oxidoreductase [Gracilibacillus salitolerans]QGH36634.1 gfo/Idh/MocA family oxidoreductase [Gracilibacillus salitolerans]